MYKDCWNPAHWRNGSYWTPTFSNISVVLEQTCTYIPPKAHEFLLFLGYAIEHLMVEFKNKFVFFKNIGHWNRLWRHGLAFRYDRQRERLELIYDLYKEAQLLMDTIKRSVPAFCKEGQILDFDFWLDMTQHPTALNVQTHGQMLLVDT